MVPLPCGFYEASAAVVAPKLLGHWLVRRKGNDLLGGIIVEAEAYLADDPACHAFRGVTRRNQSMFGPPGHAYVYYIYGNHHCVNAVCRPAGIGEAVLIRAIEPLFGLEQISANRPGCKPLQLTNGPGKLCGAFEITRELDGANLCEMGSPLFIAQNPKHAETLRQWGPVEVSRRIGITKAADLPLRFFLGGNQHVSRRQKASARAVEKAP